METQKPIHVRSRRRHRVVIGANLNKLRATFGSYALEDLLVAEDSQRAFQRFLKIALRMCNAGSAGLSLLRLNAAGQAAIRWEAISGALASHVGAESPYESSPCGECLDAAAITILSEPQRAFSPLGAISPTICQDLIVPLYDALDNPVGTLWIAHHDPALCFGEADVRIAEQLGIVLSRALRMFAADRVALESHDVVKQATADDLSAERTRREQAEASESKIRKALVFKEAELLDAHHRVKNTIQIAANYLQLQARRASSEASVALQDSYSRLHLLAEVHELLYKGNDPARRVSMWELLSTVAETLRQSFTQLSDRVVLRTAIEPMLLVAEIAIPLASLANEAATNAYKHAFADGRAGEISITLRHTPEAALVLQISDNGMGLRSKTIKSTLGLDLIDAFAAQLQGTLVFTKPAEGPGTMLTLTIPAAAIQPSPT